MDHQQAGGIHDTALWRTSDGLGVLTPCPRCSAHRWRQLPHLPPRHHISHQRERTRTSVIGTSCGQRFPARRCGAGRMGLGFSPLAPDSVPFAEARTLTRQTANARHQSSRIKHHVMMHMRFTMHGQCHTIPQAPHAQCPFYGTGTRSWFGFDGTDCAA